MGGDGDRAVVCFLLERRAVPSLATGYRVLQVVPAFPPAPVSPPGTRPSRGPVTRALVARSPMNTHVFTHAFSQKKGDWFGRRAQGSRSERFHVAVWGSCAPHKESDKLGETAKDSAHISPQPLPQLLLLARAQPEGKVIAMSWAPAPN